MPDRLALLRAIEAAAPANSGGMASGADEDERRPNAKEVLAITRRLNRFHALRIEGERLAWQEDSWDFSQVRAADIACLAVCSFSELQKLGRRAPAWLEAEPAFRVLAERNPPWL
jgi:ABC-type transporter Mla MlaB component